MSTRDSLGANEHIYECPECGCEFARGEDEPEVCKCAECGAEIDTRERGCTCCR